MTEGMIKVVFLLYFACVAWGGTCPHPGWKYRDGYCYQIFHSKKTRNDAEKTCFGESTHLKAHLASIQSHDENYFISNSVAQTKTSWIGLNDLGNREGFFLWNDGSPMDFTYWLDGQPALDSADNEDCAVINKYDHDEGELPIAGYWADESCDQLYPFVCKMRAF